MDLWTPLVERGLEVMNLLEAHASEMINSDIMMAQDKNSDFYKQSLEDQHTMWDQAEKELGTGDGRLTRKAWDEYRRLTIEFDNERYGTNTGFLGDEEMLELEYVCLNTIEPSAEGITFEESIRALDYFFYIMSHMDKLPTKVTQV